MEGKKIHSLHHTHSFL